MGTDSKDCCNTSKPYPNYIKKVIKLKDIELLNKKYCCIKDPEKVENIINELIYGGPERLQIVSDFDFTITKQRTSNGEPVLSSFGIFNSCKCLPEEFVRKTKELHDKYRPIEVDPHMPIEEKIKHMIDWWTISSEILVGFAFDLAELDAIAGRFKNSLRDNTHELFCSLNRLDIPVLVFSAGLGDAVVSVLKQANVLHPNVKVISNFLQFKDGLLNGFQVPMIHTYSKNETVLQGTDYYDLVHSRDHVIVMGDSLGDAGMANGVPSSSHIIKIGFLFDHVAENLDKYMDAFDIVLIDDQTMNVPIALLSLIEDHHKDSITNDKE